MVCNNDGDVVCRRGFSPFRTAFFRRRLVADNMASVAFLVDLIGVCPLGFLLSRKIVFL